MAKKHDASRLLKSGNNPRDISTELNIGLSTVKQYLYTQVGEGAIKRSDILFSIPAEERTLIEAAIILNNGRTNANKLQRAIQTLGGYLDQELILIYLDLRDARVSMGDMYELIYEIEIYLHDLIKKVLITEFGPNENGWWRQGISPKIRAICASTREEDTEPADEPYCYTNFIHLQEIIDKQWDLFTNILPGSIVNEKKKFLHDLIGLNRIRNSIMHPIKKLPITEDDFIFVRRLRATIMSTEIPLD